MKYGLTDSSFSDRSVDSVGVVGRLDFGTLRFPELLLISNSSAFLLLSLISIESSVARVSGGLTVRAYNNHPLLLNTSFWLDSRIIRDADLEEG